MIETSEKYKQVMKYQLRPRSHIKVTFNNSNNTFEGSSYRADAINGISMPNKMRGFYFHNETCYAFLSKDFMRTDGTQIVVPTDASKRYDIGYISSALSASTTSTDTDENGNTITGYAVTNDKGIAGPTGADGKTPYLHIAYANSADGTNGFYVGGGQNLLQGTGTASGDVANGTGTLVKGAFNGYDAVKTNTAWEERYINLKSALGRTNAKAGDWYTISVYVKADKQIDTGHISAYRALGNVDANTNDGFLSLSEMSNKPITTQWQQYSWSFQINDISIQRQNTRVEYNLATGDNWIYWAGWMLEEGTISHPWSPAPSEAHPIYIGTYTDYTQADSTDPTSYNWTFYRVGLRISSRSEHYEGMKKLSITFDKNQNTYPVLVEVNGGREETPVVFTRKVACTSNEFVYIGGVNDTPSNYLYSINFKMLNNPQSRIHITRIVLGDTVVYDDSKITSAELTKNVSITSSELSYHDFSMTVNNYGQEYNPVNPTGIFKNMNSNLKFVVEMGRDLTMNDGEDTEWLTVASLYTDGQPTFDKDSYTIHGVDSLSVLTDKGYKNLGYYEKNYGTTYRNYTVDQEVQNLFSSSRKSSVILGFNPFPSIFATAKIKNVVPLDSINNQFQLIANYLKEVVFSDKDGRITFKDAVIPFVTASDNGRMYYSSSSDVINSTKLPTNIYTNLHKDYMSTSYNSNQLVPPLSQPPIKGIGFISQNVSDSSGNIADVTFTVNYSMAFEQTSFIITFNSVDKEYAVAFTVKFYNNGTLVGTITETNNTLVNYSKTIDFNADKIVINITKWSKPSRFAVINQINSGRILNYIIDFNDMKEYPSIENIKQTAIVNSKYHTITESDSQEDVATIQFSNDTNDHYIIEKNVYGNPTNTTIIPGGMASTDTCSFANQNSLYIRIVGISSATYVSLYKATTANDTEATASVTYNSSGDIVTYDNKLCESNIKATDLANWYYNYVKKGQKFTISYRGDPALEPFDFIYIQSQFEDEYVPVVVTKTTLDFDGGISGKIECIRV